MKYPLAERFKAPQGEGLFSGTPMAFMRTVGCSVGKKVCTHCDTEFDRVRSDLGGGSYTTEQLVEFVGDYTHACFTGGEPLDRDLRAPLVALHERNVLCHVETSGTVHPDWLDAHRQPRATGQHAIGMPAPQSMMVWRWMPLWVTVSPKPGYMDSMVERVADEIKVILGGLGDGDGWPTLDDAIRWANQGRMVFVQPRNSILEIDHAAMREALAVVERHPQLRLSCQLHKYLRTR